MSKRGINIKIIIKKYLIVYIIKYYIFIKYNNILKVFNSLYN
jgi:hypothetical protein